MRQQVIGKILERQGVLSSQALAQLIAQCEEKQLDLLEVGVAQNMLTEAGVAEALARECGLGYVPEIAVDQIALDVAVRVPISYAKAHKVLLAAEFPTHFDVICADPLNVAALDDLRALLGRPVLARVATSQAVVDAINRVYERQDAIGELESEKGLKDEEQVDLLDSDDDAPIIRWVNALFSQAVKARTSDIHIEPEEKEVIVRYRVDGELYIARRTSRQFMSSVIARVKIMAGLNIAEKRLPQDGRISLKIAGRPLDVRVSTVPTSRDHERIVMRLLQKTNILLDLADLGFSARDYGLMESLIRRPDGIILVTGPTGSGKTTTLYACLNRINQPHRNILTAEDPVE